MLASSSAGNVAVDEASVGLNQNGKVEAASEGEEGINGEDNNVPSQNSDERHNQMHLTQAASLRIMELSQQKVVRVKFLSSPAPAIPE